MEKKKEDKKRLKINSEYENLKSERINKREENKAIKKNKFIPPEEKEIKPKENKEEPNLEELKEKFLGNKRKNK